MVCAFVFVVSPTTQVQDSRFSLLVSESLLYRQTFDLRAYSIRIPWQPDWIPFYQLSRVDRKIVYAYPLGGSILSVPFVALFNLCGLSAAPHQHFDPYAEDAMQRLIAACLMATLTCIFYRAARLLLPAVEHRHSSGSCFRNTSLEFLSRGLWGQTWAVLLAGYLMYRLLEDDVGGRPLNGVSLATVTSWMFFTRPTGAIVAVAVSIYLAWNRKRVLILWIVTGLFWLACFVALSMKVYGQALPQYYLGGFLQRGHVLEGIAGILFSPSRGWFVFVPMSLWVLYLILRNYAALPHRALALVALGIGLAEVPLIACDTKWWGGYRTVPG